MASFDEIAGVIFEYGQPYDGVTLRHTGRRPQVACRQCGELEPLGMAGWASDWLTLCQEVRAHALEKGEGHEVAVSLWLGAVYAPVRESTIPGDTTEGGSAHGRGEGPQGPEAAQAAPGGL